MLTMFLSCIRFHPTYVPFWILSATWEYTHNDNIISARAIFQRGNRMNPKSKELLLEYCRLELLYREKIMKRLEVLDIDRETVLRQLQEESAHDNSIPEGELPDSDNHGEGISSETKNLFFDGAIPLTIFNFAVKTFPKDLRLREQYISLFNGFDDTENMLDSVYESIERDFPHCSSAKAILMRRSYDLLKDESEIFSSINEVIGNFEMAILEKADDNISIELYKFLKEALSKETEKENADDDLIGFLEKKISQLSS